MRRIWNMTADAGKGKSKQYLIKMFLLLNSIVWGVIAVVVAVTLKGIGLMSSWSMAESILVSAGYGICLVGLIGGTVCILQNDGPDRTETGRTLNAFSVKCKINFKILHRLYVGILSFLHTCYTMMCEGTNV